MIKFMNPHWIDELENKHVGETAFLLGNGLTLSYYDPEKMRKDGVLLGCNKLFTRCHVDYLFFQDSNTLEISSKFKGPKIVPVRRLDANPCMCTPEALASTYVYSKGRKRRSQPNPKRYLSYASTGTHALQVAVLMGFKKIILAGCDCRVFEKPDARQGFTANIFHDKIQSSRILSKMKKNPIIKDGDMLTSTLLKKFARHMTWFYEEVKDRVEIVLAGSWAIPTLGIPRQEFPEYWSVKHPNRKGDADDSGGS